MKFFIKDNPISYNEIYGCIQSYMRESLGARPSYMLIHPSTKRNIIISSQDQELGMQYRVVNMQFTKDREEIKDVEQMFGLYLLQSEDVEPGFVIICG